MNFDDSGLALPPLICSLGEEVFGMQLELDSILGRGKGKAGVSQMEQVVGREKRQGEVPLGMGTCMDKLGVVALEPHLVELPKDACMDKLGVVVVEPHLVELPKDACMDKLGVVALEPHLDKVDSQKTLDRQDGNMAGKQHQQGGGVLDSLEYQRMGLVVLFL